MSVDKNPESSTKEWLPNTAKVSCTNLESQASVSLMANAGICLHLHFV